MLRQRWLALFLPLSVLFILPLAAGVSPVAAGNATVQPPCDEAAFDAALASVQNSGGGTVSFNCGGAVEIELLGTKTITGHVSFAGGGLITLKGFFDHQLFVVLAGGRLGLNGLTLTAGRSFSSDGGAIANAGTLVIDHSTFRDNATGSAFSGGAIVSTGSLTVTDSLFESNQAGGGGALYTRFTGSRTYLRNTTFRGNHAVKLSNGWGGALLLWDGAPVVIDGGGFYSNTARDGGAIYNTSLAFASSVWLTDTVFQDNTATNLRGGALVNAGWLTMTGGSFTHNVISPTTVLPAAGGGLANLDSGSAVLAGVNFLLNTSSADAGGISNTGLLLMTGGALSNNQAADLGGGAYLSGTAELSATTVSGNHAFRGGGLFVDLMYLNLTNLALEDNQAINNGGGLYSQGHLLLSHVTLRANHAGTGGGLFLHDAGNLLSGLTFIDHTTLAGNTAADGGGLYQDGGLLNLTDSTVSQNFAARGAGLAASSSHLQVQRSALWGNQATSYGGALALNFTDTLLENVTLSGNTADSGGALRTFSTGPTNLRNVTISHNSATTGGGLHILAGPQGITLTNTIVANSLAGGNCNGNITAANYSLSSDLTCALPGTGNHTHTDPKLTGLGSYGGPTRTHMLKLGSPAIDGVALNDAPAKDQRGLDRPQLAGFDIGAVERQPNDVEFVPWALLPLVRR